ncbi:response regulator [Candidatus Riflebacteria bacterium]
MKKILIIEDTVGIREDVRTVLGFEGYEVIEAEDGAVGVTKAFETLPDLILCDIRMPHKNGFEVLVELQNDPKTAMIPFVFLTASADKDSLRKGMDLGADDYITKPFTTDELLSAIQMRFDKKKQQTEEGEKKLAELRGNIIHSLPHELLTPLTVIMGSVSLLASPGTLDDEKRIKLAEKIGSASTRLKNQIRKFLQFAQIEIISNDAAGIEKLKQIKTPSAEKWLNFVVNANAEKAGRKGDLQIKLSDSPIFVSEENFKIILEELLENAFKFSPLSTPIEIENTIDENGYTIHITDHGRGMSSEQIEAIGAYMQFERKLYEQQGSGLGLIAAKRLMELHGGTLTIDSEPDKFTRVNLTFRMPNNGS